MIHSVENFFGDLLQTKNFTFLDAGDPARRAARRARCSWCSQIVITVIAAAFYNLFAELFGGIEITITEDETAAVARGSRAGAAFATLGRSPGL